MRDRRRSLIRDPGLGTTGSGNHFVELQVVDRLLDRHQAFALGLRADELVVMIHSGSRDVGFHVGQRWMDRARTAWPRGRRHPASGPSTRWAASWPENTSRPWVALRAMPG